MGSQPLSFQLPNGKAEEVVLIRLPDGRVIARTRGELAELPRELRDEVTPRGETPK